MVSQPDNASVVQYIAYADNRELKYRVRLQAASPALRLLLKRPALLLPAAGTVRGRTRVAEQLPGAGASTASFSAHWYEKACCTADHRHSGKCLPMFDCPCLTAQAQIRLCARMVSAVQGLTSYRWSSSAVSIARHRKAPQAGDWSRGVAALDFDSPTGSSPCSL